MALRKIREMGEDCLRCTCKEVTEMTPRIEELIEDLIDTMYEADGVGLAAPQVGVRKRIAVVDVGEIQDKYITLQIRDKQIDKTTMNNALRLFRRYNIIEILDNDLSSEDARILIFDSILMAIRTDDIKKVSELIGQYKKEDENGEDFEEAEID